MSIQENINLQPLLTLKTTTWAHYFTKVDRPEELCQAMDWANKKHLSYCLIGGGSNIVFRSKIYPGLVIGNSMKTIRLIREDKDTVDLLVNSGCPLALLINHTIEQGWSGFEYQRGLPGTVGGALAMNSKWTRPLSFVSDSLIKATLLTKGGQMKSVDRSYFRFAYDFSIVQETGEIIVDALFRLKKTSRDHLLKLSANALAYRKQTQPFGIATCGCFFQNISEIDRLRLKIPTQSAGYLIDRCGLKNLTVGSFSVSSIHANFIINNNPNNSATADLLRLIKIIKNKIQAKYAVKLKEEVIII